MPDRWRLRKAKTLVKLLALAPRHRLHRDVVSERLWPDAEPEAAANNLHQIVLAIRRMLGAASITLNDDVVQLCPAGDLTVDVDLFEQAAAAARSSSEISALRQALDLWTGPLLPEDHYADWAASASGTTHRNPRRSSNACSDPSSSNRASRQLPWPCSNHSQPSAPSTNTCTGY